MFEVGDEVFCEEFGIGAVIEVDRKSAIYPVAVNFKGVRRVFTIDGYFTGDKELLVGYKNFKIIKLEKPMSKPQCTTQAEVFDQFARVSRLIEGTELRIQEVFKVDNRLLKTLHVSQRPQLYSFALAIVEDEPVFPGDTLYLIDEKQKITISHSIGGMLSCARENASNYLAVAENLAWKAPKRTFMLNGEELPLPDDINNWYIDIHEFSWKTSEDRDKVRSAIKKLLSGE